METHPAASGATNTKGLKTMSRAFGASETILDGPDLVSVINTTGGNTLATLLGKAVKNSLTRLVLIPASAGVFFASGAAAATSAPLPTGGIEFPCRKSEADALKFFGTTIAMTVIQIG